MITSSALYFALESRLIANTTARKLLTSSNSSNSSNTSSNSSFPSISSSAPISSVTATGTSHNSSSVVGIISMAIQPIVGRLRRGLVLDLSVALGLGMTMGYAFWYGYHVPSIKQRDAYYAKLEREREGLQR